MTNAFAIRCVRPASPPKKWLWRLAADRRGRRLAQVDDFPPQPYSRSVGILGLA